MNQDHCYLFALEIRPLQVGAVYDELPLHCTLMHRFWTDATSEVLQQIVHPLFDSQAAVELVVEASVLLGPKQVRVSEIVLSNQLKSLHDSLHTILDSMGVKFTAPEWVGRGYRAHSTDRLYEKLNVGDVHRSAAVYLIEVNMPGFTQQRFVRHKFVLL